LRRRPQPRRGRTPAAPPLGDHRPDRRAVGRRFSRIGSIVTIGAACND